MRGQSGRLWRMLRQTGPNGSLLRAGLALTLLYGAVAALVALPWYFPGPGRAVNFVYILPGDWWLALLAFGGVVAFAFAVFGVALGAVWRAGGGGVSRRLLFGFPLLFVLALVWLYPLTSRDMFHYHADARTFWVFGDNPLTVPPSVHGYPIRIAWPDQPSPYGPLWSLIAVAPVWATGDRMLPALLAFKLLIGGAYLLCAVLVYRVARRVRPGWEPVAVVLFAWNPFVVLRAVGNGHNDVVMLVFVLLALAQAERRRWWLAFPAFAASVLVKFGTALLGPLLLLFALRQGRGALAGRVGRLLPGLALAALVLATAYAPFWEGRATFDTVLGEANGKAANSPAFLLQRALAPAIGEDRAGASARWLTRLPFLALYLPLVWQAGASFPRLLSSGFTALLLYLVLAASWFQPWYLLWPLALGVLLPSGRVAVTLVAFSFAGCFLEVIEGYRAEWPPFASGWPRLLLPVVATVWLPLLLWLAAVARARTWHLLRPGPAAPARKRRARAARRQPIG